MPATYQIAKVSDGIGGLKDMVQVTGYDPQPTEFLEYTEVVAMSLSGKPIESGFAKTRWHWLMLTQQAFDALVSYCTGASADVYVRTRVNSGTVFNYGVFRATMQRPKAKTEPGYLRADVIVDFTNLRTPP